MEKTSKKLVVVSVLIAFIITGIGVAFGYFMWNSTSNTDISFTVSGAIVELEDGKDITGANLMPVASYTSGGSNVVKKDVKVKLKDTTTDTVTVDFKLNINSIDSGLNHSSFKYNLVNSSGTSIKTGNFATSKKGDSISLLTLSTTDGSLTTSTTSYTLYIYIDGSSGDNPSSMQNQGFDFSLDVTGSNSMLEKVTSAVETIEALDDGTTGDTGSGVYKVTHSAIAAESSATGSEIPAVTDYRYYGSSPNNYVCLDNSGGTCEDRHLYRIIGSIYEENAGQNLLKVIKATWLQNDDGKSQFSWDCGGNLTSVSNIKKEVIAKFMVEYSPDVCMSSGYNKWEGSPMMEMLNGSWYNGEINYVKYSLGNNAKNLLNIQSRYYLGGYDNSDLKTNDAYLKEREMITSSSNLSSYWDGKVGLIYPSDYGYASGTICVNNSLLSNYYGNCSNWISETFFWTITPTTKNDYNLYIISPSVKSISTGNFLYIRPTFYLKPTVSITSGTGTQTDPYILSVQ